MVLEGRHLRNTVSAFKRFLHCIGLGIGPFHSIAKTWQGVRLTEVSGLDVPANCIPLVLYKKELEKCNDFKYVRSKNILSILLGLRSCDIHHNITRLFNFK